MRKLNPPFRWDANALSKIELSAMRVLDADTQIRVELYTRANAGERVVQTIDVPFIPRVLHADCISIKDHDAKVAKEVEKAVERATTSGERVVALEKENDQLRSQAAAAYELLKVVRDIDKLNLLFATRPAYGHALRTKIKAFDGADFPAFVTEAMHKAVTAKHLAERAAAVASAITDTVERFRGVLESVAQKLSTIGTTDPKVEVRETLNEIDRALTTKGS